MEEIITGYQWGVGMEFIGAYQFPRNMDSETIHVPPSTTLAPPPSVIPEGQEAAWIDGEWVLRDKA